MRHPDIVQRRIKQVDLASTVGAGVLGAGISALLARYLDVANVAAALIVVGVLLLHGWGMFERHRVDGTETIRLWWSEALYWFCWVGLAAILVLLFVRR